MKYRYIFTVIAFLLLSVTHAFSQARSSFGFTLGVNRTFNRFDHELTAGCGLIGNVRIVDRLALEGALSIYEVNTYAAARLSAKVYATPRAFFTIGALHWVEGDFRTGTVTSVSAGYRIFSKPMHNFELSVHGNFGKYVYNSTPVAGLRAAYNFNFKSYRPALS